MPPRASLLIAALVVATTAAVGTAHATVLADPGLDALVRRATTIVHGRVASQRASLEIVGAIGEVPVTRTAIAPIRTLLGAHATIVEVREIGGRAGGRSAEIEGGARYRVGEEVVAILAEHDGSLRTVGMSLGLFHVEHLVAARDLDGAVVVAGARVEGPSSLPALLDRLERAIARRR